MLHRRALVPVFKFAAICATGALVHLAGCDDQPELPPEDPPKIRPIEVDVKHSAQIKADRAFTIANLVLVLQSDPVSGGSMGVTLSTARPALDGSRLIFGTFEKADTVEALARQDIDFAGPAILDAHGNGIFTPLGAYVPKLARLRITSHGQDQAAGTIAGDFYHYKLAQPALRPPVVHLDVTFSAKLVKR